MGTGADRNKKCSCGSGIKEKFCNCKKNKLAELFPNKTIETEVGTFHILDIRSSDEYPGILEEDAEGRFYRPFYNQDQIDRILNPKTAYDILLKKQADSVIDSMRVTREMYHRYHRATNWNIEDCFVNEAFELFFASIAEKKEHKICCEIPYGTTYESDVNGQCIKTEFGNIITISTALSKFLYFMNLYYLGIHNDNIPIFVSISARAIGIRIMLKSESMDFDMDPRGDIPRDIDDQLKINTTWQEMFVIAHEFSHSILGHLDDNDVIKYSANNNDSSIIYNQSQKDEFEADIFAINLLSGLFSVTNIALAAIMFFVHIDLSEQAKEQIFPSLSRIKTHPPTLERIKNVYNEFKDFLKEEDVEYALNLTEQIKRELQDDIACNFDKYEKYGSVYLGEWHKIKLIDRVDY